MSNLSNEGLRKWGRESGLWKIKKMNEIRCNKVRHGRYIGFHGGTDWASNSKVKGWRTLPKEDNSAKTEA